MAQPMYAGSASRGPGSRAPRRPGSIRADAAGYLFISPWLLGFLAFTVIPMLASAYYAFTDYDILDRPIFNGLSNFRTMFADPLFWK